MKENAENSEDLAMEMDDEFFKGKLKNGFFIEAGAFDGDCFTDVISHYNLIVFPFRRGRFSQFVFRGQT